MAGGPISMVIQHLRRMVRATDADSDGRLLERFQTVRDEAAFETLLLRHGPMVLGVCRRVLGDAHEAEDAFQAAFLVLARRAGAVRKRESVGSWLHGVAYRCALKARIAIGRAAAARRRISEHAPEADMSIEHAESDATRRELRPLLDAELDRLPEKYRQPLVLCYLEGKTKEEAARILGWPEGTVSGRLHRAKELLRSRLGRRGITLSAGGLAAAITSDAVAAVPVALIETTHRAALAFAAGNIAGAVSTPVAALAQGVIQTMMWTKLRMIAVALVALALLTSGSFVAVNKLAARQGTDASVGGRAQAQSDKEKLQGVWKVVSVVKGGKPETDARPAEMIFEGDKLIMSAEGKTATSTFKLDEKVKPKAIDITLAEGAEKEKGTTFKGIYELNGDDLRICLGAAEAAAKPPREGEREGSERPPDFKGGEKDILFTLKREAKKEDAKPKEPPAAKRESDQERLQGDWEVVKTEVFGKDAPEGEVTKGVWTFRGEKLLTKSLQDSVIQSEVKLDEKAKPKTLDVTPIDGPEGEKGKTFKGIYELTGDDLRLCMAGPGLDRPTEFKTKEGAHILLFTLKRVKKEKPEADQAAARIKTLLEEKKEAAQVSFDGRMQEFRAGRSRVDVICDASQRLTEAQVQTSASEGERLKALEAHVARAKEMEAIAKARFDTGSVNIMDYMDLKLHRIEAEIALEKEKTKAK